MAVLSLEVLYSFEVTPYLRSKGYKATPSKDNRQQITYEKREPFRLTITITEYSPLVRFGEASYFFEGFPHIGLNGVVLTKSDAIQFRSWLEHHEALARSRLAATKSSPQVQQGTQPSTSREARQQQTQLDKIVLDAGHGGHDPGSSAYGFLEKDLTLKITKDLFASLKEKGTKAKLIMVRKKDRYVSLEERCSIANRALKKGENGLFVSVHLNTWFHEGIRGFEAYYLAHSSRVMEARIHSHIEDTAFDLGNTNWKGKDPYKVIFSRLEMVQYQRESRFVAGKIMSEVQKRNRSFSTRRGVKSDLFYVLKGSLMPAILIEAGFISNKKDLEFLTNPKTRKALTDSIALGILGYEREFRETRGFSHGFFEEP